MSNETKDGPRESDDPTPSGEGASETTMSSELEEAMAAAAASVDASGADAGGKTTAGEAVTRALLDARKELEAALEQTKQEATQLRDRWMRAAADLENFRRRAAKEREDVARFGAERLLRDFLPILDDLERAVDAVASTAGGAGGAEVLLGGVRMVQKKFLSTLERHGVSSFDARGEAFNPERHEAVQQASSPLPAGAVAEQVQRGYLLHDRLLRPALVVVSMGPAGEGANAGPE